MRWSLATFEPIGSLQEVEGTSGRGSGDLHAKSAWLSIAKSLNVSEPQEGCSILEVGWCFSIKGPIVSILGFVAIWSLSSTTRFCLYGIKGANINNM